jgi:hypothetical protein
MLTPSLSRPFVTPYHKPVQDTQAERTGRRVLRLPAVRTSINPCVFLHYHPPLNTHPRESLAGAKKTPTMMNACWWFTLYLVPDKAI